jgi:NAD+ synthase (glutamine-hydrolysing)
MKDGFIKAAAASPALRVADCLYNRDRIVEAIRRAQTMEVKLLVLPELAVTGYTCGDLLGQQTLLEGAREALLDIAAATGESDLLVVVGVPLVKEGRLYNCAAVLQDGEVLGVVPKRNLPGYGEFYETRNFTPGPAGVSQLSLGGDWVPFGGDLLFRCRELPDFCLGVEICEDLWVPAPPSGALAAAGATVIANPSASDETAGKADYRRTLVTSQSARLCCAYLYADCGPGESTSDLVFSGHDLAAENGTLLAESLPFGEGWAVTEIDVERLAAQRRRTTTWPQPPEEGMAEVEFSMALYPTTLTRPVSPTPFVPGDRAARAARCRELLSIQAHGLARRLEHTGAKTAVLGISGGLDSTLALLVAAQSMDLLGRPRKDILAVTMPCFGTTARTRHNAEDLCRALEVTLRTVDITRAVEGHLADIGHDGKVLDVTYENSQARERTQVLMDLANLTGGLVVGTGDLSELALGWATYNGDHMSMYGVNASIPKTLVRHMVETFALEASETLRRVLLDILDTPVSPELLPAKDGEISQKTEDLVGPYELHDFFLYAMIRWGFTPRKTFRLARHAFAGTWDGATILRWQKVFYRRFFAQQFKRSCLPDGPKVGTVALSPRGDWRMPSDASAALWLRELESLDPEEA